MPTRNGRFWGEKIILVLAGVGIACQFFWQVAKPTVVSSLGIVILGVVFWLWFLRERQGKKGVKKIRRNIDWAVWALIVGNVILVTVVLWPFVREVTIDGTTFVGTSGVTDLFKHSYVITAMRETGLPGAHPYFPAANFSYYYGYYLVPTLVTTLFPRFQNAIIVMFIVFTDFLALALVYFVLSKVVGGTWARRVGMALVVFGMGWDIVPMFLAGKLGTPQLIEAWSITHNLGLRVDNTFVSLLWTPQHFFAATLALYLLYRVFCQAKIGWREALLLAFVGLSSAFVAISLGLGFLIVLIFFPKKRVGLGKIGLMALLLTLPYLWETIGKGKDMFQLYTRQAFSFLPGQTWPTLIANHILTLVAEYGVIFWGVGLCLALVKPKHLDQRAKCTLWLAIFVFPILTWFVRSSGYNDFALRGVILAQLLVIITFTKFLDTAKGKAKWFGLGLVGVTLLLSVPGFAFEYTSRWRERTWLTPYESELVKNLRRKNLNGTLAALGRDEWIYKIPPLAFRPVLTRSLYDAGAYFSAPKGMEQGKWSAWEEELFWKQNVGGFDKIVSERKKYLARMGAFMDMFTFDWLLVDRQMGYKEGKTAWVHLFEEKGLAKIDVTNRFVAFNRTGLRNYFTHNTLGIDDTKQVSITTQNRQAKVPAGVWYAVICNGANTMQFFRMMPENTYQIMEAHLVAGECMGNVFWQPDEGIVKFEEGISSEIILLPVVVNPVVLPPGPPDALLLD